MQTHELKPNKPGRKKAARIGRGGKRGTTAGRGTKGQKSRAGTKMRPAIRDYIQRLPKLRGYDFAILKDKPEPVTLNDLNKVEGDIVNLETLKKAGVVSKKSKTAKILNTGEVTKAFTVEQLAVSSAAKKKIEAAGGTIKA
ncbi:MAG: 50S ribosomal protein L15 [Candidatus Harrisonbacteria bacterium CG10_big_fil_rev_8_21_14_0_10_38_8]|uniref:Large ribosomal subunit protein uL15 n=1 Tax=Candidatus Harrisonbacteria bacterium CG10_big_fil_rev_8_21_14_0_10_38_8 TaxID=1974582 RepID=A0A2M6WK60_9BACT|nr:MAG: 50S ribosomal protein L15 [Candidatus Harrisonbacteria bacterium CG10_big_fil_rev_8_21_14_0_10_38_8]